MGSLTIYRCFYAIKSFDEDNAHEQHLSHFGMTKFIAFVAGCHE